MQEQRCFLIGHRETSERVYLVLEKTVRALAEKGVKEFFVGQHGSFDALAAHAVKQVKKTHADAKLILLLAYCPFERSDLIPAGFDESIYPSVLESVPRSAAIVRANQWMMCHCLYLVCHVVHLNSNSGRILQEAQRRGKVVLNLAQRAGEEGTPLA